jgi:anti-sigma factor RsiW
MVEGLGALHSRCPAGVLQDAGGWVLGALEAADARRFADHLPACRACREAAAELQPAAEALLALSLDQPPRHLAATTLARVQRAAASAARRSSG